MRWRLKTFILHANQTVYVRSRGKHWHPETLRSKPTLSVHAKSLADAIEKAKEQVRKRYDHGDTEVTGVDLTVALHRELS